MTGDQWYYRLGGRPHGPFTPTQFQKLVRGGTITPETEVSPDGRAWKPLRDVPSDGLPEPAVPPSDSMLAPTLSAVPAASPAEGKAGQKPPS